MTTATLTKPVAAQDTDTVVEPEQSCQMFKASTGEQCDRPPVAWVEFHRIGECRSCECNARGNMEGNCCAEHLDGLIELAVEVAQLARPGFELQCTSCRLPIYQASDILQKVIRK